MQLEKSSLQSLKNKRESDKLVHDWRSSNVIENRAGGNVISPYRLARVWQTGKGRGTPKKFCIRRLGPP